MKKKKFIYISAAHLILYGTIFVLGLTTCLLTYAFYSNLHAFAQSFFVNFSAAIIASAVLAFLVDNISSRIEYNKFITSRTMFIGILGNGIELFFRRLSKILFSLDSGIQELPWQELLVILQQKLANAEEKLLKNGFGWSDVEQCEYNNARDLYDFYLSNKENLLLEVRKLISKKDLLVLHGVVSAKQDWEVINQFYNYLEEDVEITDIKTQVEGISKFKNELEKVVVGMPDLHIINNSQFYKYKIIRKEEN